MGALLHDAPADRQGEKPLQLVLPHLPGAGSEVPVNEGLVQSLRCNSMICACCRGWLVGPL